MRIALADWLFEVDVDATDRYTTNCTVDHGRLSHIGLACECDLGKPILRKILGCGS